MMIKLERGDKYQQTGENLGFFVDKSLFERVASQLGDVTWAIKPTPSDVEHEAKWFSMVNPKANPQYDSYAELAGVARRYAKEKKIIHIDFYCFQHRQTEFADLNPYVYLYYDAFIEAGLDD